MFLGHIATKQQTAAEMAKWKINLHQVTTVQIPIVWLVNQEISKCPAQFICRFGWDCTLSWYFLSSIHWNERPLIFEAAHLGNLSLFSYIFYFYYTQVIFRFFSPYFCDDEKQHLRESEVYSIRSWCLWHFWQVDFLTLWMKHLFRPVFIFYVFY